MNCPLDRQDDCPVAVDECPSCKELIEALESASTFMERISIPLGGTYDQMQRAIAKHKTATNCG